MANVWGMSLRELRDIVSHYYEQQVQELTSQVGPAARLNLNVVPHGASYAGHVSDGEEKSQADLLRPVHPDFV